MDRFSAKLKKFFKTLGPGFITGASDDDPTAIASYTQAGAQFGYTQLWTTFWLTPFMIVVQEMCGRIGMVTGKGLAGVIGKHYSKSLLYLIVALLVTINTINIGANLGAMAASAQMLFNIPFIFWLVFLTVLILVMEVFISYKVYANLLKYLALTLLTYVAVALIVKQDWLKILTSTLIPSFSLKENYLLNLVAVLGTNISPFLFFWQASEEVEEEVEKHQIQAMGRGVPKINNRDLREMRLDTIVGMVFSNIIVFFLCITAASTLGAAGITNVETPQQAALALKPIAGSLSFLLFAMGIIGSGLLAVPVLAGSASYAVSEALGMREGLGQKFKRAHGFYGVITVATLVGLLVNFIGIRPFEMLIYSAALNGILAAPLLLLIILITNNRKIMGEHTNHLWTNLLGILITLFMALAAVILLVSIFGKGLF